jgi:hypothetical protein
MGDSPISTPTAPISIPIRKEKQNPLLSRGSFKPKPGPAGRNKNQFSPRSVLVRAYCSALFLTRPYRSPQTQSIMVDVSQSLDEVQAPRDTVKSTAIALIRQESVFLPDTTIGATHWVAYAMTQGSYSDPCYLHSPTQYFRLPGRVRVISRSSGDRTLLQLSATFSQAAVITDMAVYGMKGFSGQNYIYDMTCQIYDMKYEMICCISVRTLCKSM